MELNTIARSFKNGRWAKSKELYIKELAYVFKRIKHGEEFSRDNLDEECMCRAISSPHYLKWKVCATKDQHIVFNDFHLQCGVLTQWNVGIGKSKVDVAVRVNQDGMAWGNEYAKYRDLANGDEWTGYVNTDCHNDLDMKHGVRTACAKAASLWLDMNERSEYCVQLLKLCKDKKMELGELMEQYNVRSMKWLTNEQLQDFASRVGFSEATTIRDRMSRAFSRAGEMRRLISEQEA